MTKADLVKTIAGKPFNTQKESGEAVDAMIGGITLALTAGEDVKLSGLGTFKVKTTKAHTGRNPKTGEAIQIAAKKRVTFSPGKELKARIQGGE